MLRRVSQPMSTITACPNCNKRVAVPVHLRRSNVRCPFCGGTFLADGDDLPPTVGSAESQIYSGYQSGRPTWIDPHRGGLILTLSILGLVCCAPLSLVAWLIGANDLSRIRHGTMDPSGYGTTQAGMIIGIVGTVLWILSLGILFLAALAES